MEMDILVNAIRTPQDDSTSQTDDSSMVAPITNAENCQCSFVGGKSSFQKMARFSDTIRFSALHLTLAWTITAWGSQSSVYQWYKYFFDSEIECFSYLLFSHVPSNPSLFFILVMLPLLV